MPAAGDAPTASAAPSLPRPSAIACQNNRSTSRRSDGFPGDFIGALPVNSVIHPAGLPITTLLAQALRRPVESTQYTSLVFTRRCRAVGIAVSMGSRGDCFDNAVQESFHASLKKDLIHRRSWPTKTEARTAAFGSIEAFYTRRPRHSTLGMLSPVDYENSALTLGQDRPGLAASRLVSTKKNLITTTTTAKVA
jgi:hypothetical protein